MSTGEKLVKSFLLLIAATICGFAAGALVGGVVGLFISIGTQPGLVFSLAAPSIGAATGMMWGSVIGLLVGFIYLFPRARRYCWLIASLGAIVGFFCGQSLITAPFINGEMAAWIPVGISVLSGAACALLVAVVLQRVTAESRN